MRPLVCPALVVVIAGGLASCQTEIPQASTQPAPPPATAIPDISLPPPPKAPAPLTYGDGACVGDPPAPVCTPEHLTTPKELVAPRSCATRADCLPTEFCGAGACRELQGEKATLCIERAWLQGQLCQEVDEISVSVRTAYSGGDWGYVFWQGPIVADGSCVAEIHHCDEVDLLDLAREGTEFGVFAYAPDERWTYHSAVEYFAGHERIRSLINAGCYTITNRLSADPEEAQPRAHIALWYP